MHTHFKYNLDTIIITENLGKTVNPSAGPLHILSSVDLKIKSAESVAIMGASGSGKSTLLGLLAGLDVPTCGTIMIAGQNLTAMNEDGRALLRNQMIGFVFQSFQLLPSLTALENVMLPLELRGDRKALAGAEKLLHRVGLASRLSHTPSQLSGGEQQRVSIARAFVNRPPVLLADEPTGNLDPATSLGIMSLLNRINKTGTTVLIATHDREMVDSMRKRVIALENGKIIRDQSRGVYGYGD